MYLPSFDANTFGRGKQALGAPRKTKTVRWQRTCQKGAQQKKALPSSDAPNLYLIAKRKKKKKTRCCWGKQTNKQTNRCWLKTEEAHVVMVFCLISLIQSRPPAPPRRRSSALPRRRRRPGRPPFARPGTPARLRRLPACWIGWRRGWRPPLALGRGRYLSEERAKTKIVTARMLKRAAYMYMCMYRQEGALFL